MKILALEFSSAQRSAAVVETGAPGARSAEAEVVESGARSTRTLGLVEAALRQASVEREQIECVAVGLGPGSYVGVRAAIALAQGWRLARPVKVIGVSSAEALAAQAHAEGIVGCVAVVIDAQRREFYVAEYQVQPAGWREIRALHLATLAQVEERQHAGSVLVGPGIPDWFPAGRQMYPRAGSLGRLALGRSEVASADQLEPIYLRETQFVKAPPPRRLPSGSQHPAPSPKSVTGQ